MVAEGFLLVTVQRRALYGIISLQCYICISGFQLQVCFLLHTLSAIRIRPLTASAISTKLSTGSTCSTVWVALRLVVSR